VIVITHHYGHRKGVRYLANGLKVLAFSLAPDGVYPTSSGVLHQQHCILQSVIISDDVWHSSAAAEYLFEREDSDSPRSSGSAPNPPFACIKKKYFFILLTCMTGIFHASNGIHSSRRFFSYPCLSLSLYHTAILTARSDDGDPDLLYQSLGLWVFRC
jgi:hypothetical protein